MSVLRPGSLELPGTPRAFQGEMRILPGPDLLRGTCVMPVRSDGIKWTVHPCETLEDGNTNW